MKRTTAARARGKSRSAPKTVQQYLERLPPSSRSAFHKLRQAVRSAVPPGTIEEVSYGIPARKRGKVLVWYGAFKQHCSLFPTASVVAALAQDLKGYETSKGAIKFPVNRPIPVALVRRIVKERTAQAGRSEDRKRKPKF